MSRNAMRRSYIRGLQYGPGAAGVTAVDNPHQFKKIGAVAKHLSAYNFEGCIGAQHYPHCTQYRGERQYFPSYVFSECAAGTEPYCTACRVLQCGGERNRSAGDVLARLEAAGPGSLGRHVLGAFLASVQTEGRAYHHLACVRFCVQS